MKIYIILILLIFAGIKAGSQSLEINGEDVKKIEFKKNLTLNIKTNHIVALKNNLAVRSVHATDCKYRASFAITPLQQQKNIKLTT